MTDDTPLRQAYRLADAFERHGVPYAIGGALAYSIWGVPRNTLDVDVNVFVDERGLSEVIHALTSLGIMLDANQAQRDAAGTGLIVTKLGPYRLDLFTDSIPFCQEARRTRVPITVDGVRRWFLSAEAVAVFKLMFFRPKDVLDLERLVAVQGERLNHDYVRDQLVAMVGDDDERVRRWDQLVAPVREAEYSVETPMRIDGDRAHAVLRRRDGTQFEHEASVDELRDLQTGDTVRLDDFGQLKIVGLPRPSRGRGR